MNENDATGEAPVAHGSPETGTRLPFLPALLALIVGMILGTSLHPALPFLAAAALLLAWIARRNNGDLRALGLAVLLLSLLLGSVNSVRMESGGRPGLDEPSPISARAGEIGSWRLGNFTRAVLLGEIHALQPQDRANYRRSGLTHLLAISGLNMSIIAALIWFVVRAVMRRGAGAPIVAAAGVLIYTFGIGAPPSALRAGLMAAVFFLAHAVARPARALNVLFGAAFLTLLFDPAALIDPGFQLSYAAAYGLIVWTRPLSALLPAHPRVFFSIVAGSLAAQAITMPLMAWHFRELAPLAFFANLIVIPVFSLLIPLSAAALLGVPFAASIADRVLGVMTDGVALLAGLPGASFLIDRPTPLAFAGALALAALPLLTGRRVRFLALTVGGSALFLGLIPQPGGEGLFALREKDFGRGVAVMAVRDGEAALLDEGISAAGWKNVLADHRVRRIREIQCASPFGLYSSGARGLCALIEVDRFCVPGAWVHVPELADRIEHLRAEGFEVALREEKNATVLYLDRRIALTKGDPDTTASLSFSRLGWDAMKVVRGPAQEVIRFP